MRIVLQRVKQASVTVEQQTVGSIKQGLLLLFGVHKQDQPTSIDWLVKKITHLRIFADEEGKMNHSISDIEGAILVVSQFTLYANCTRGRRPDFIDAAPPEKAEELYNEFVLQLRQQIKSVETGIFGANMEVNLMNDGPVTLVIDHGK